jgi:L-amino acid N-acyltransferase
MNPRIRDARPADLGDIDRIYHHYVLTSTSTYQLAPDGPEARAAWFAQHDARHPVVVAEDDAEGIMGWGSLSRFRARAGYDLTVEDSVYVHHSRHGLGIGSRILAHLLARAQGLGYHTIVAGISADQEPSVRLHEKFGFVEMGRMREVGRKFERWLDVVFMQKFLAA